jgi:DNA topoisomerase-1
MESLSEIPSMNYALLEKIHANHIYTVAELARSAPDLLGERLAISEEEAGKLIHGAGVVLESLRRRSEFRKFLRDVLVPRKGRSYAKIMTSLKGSGVTELADLVRVDTSVLKKAGISETEAEQVLSQGRTVYNSQLLKEIGIPAVSLKKYLAAGIGDPEAFCTHTSEALSTLTGVSPATVHRHIEMVCNYLKRPIPVKYSKAQLDRGKKDLLKIKGLNEATIVKLFQAGIITSSALLIADPVKAAEKSGIPLKKIVEYQEIIRKKKENAVIEI